MSQFKDAASRTWTIAITVGAIKAVREALDVDLANTDAPFADRLADDPVLLVDVLWVLCRSQADKLGITSEQFGEALVGDPIDDATKALITGISDFFPGQRRSLLQRANAKMQSVRERAEKLAMEKLDDPELEAKVQAAMTTRLDAEIQSALTRLSSPTS